MELTYDDELIDVKVKKISDPYLDALDEYIRARILIKIIYALPGLGKFNKRNQDASGNPIGKLDSNPIFDTSIYELEFPDRHIEKFAVNVLADNIFNQADLDGWDTRLIDEEIDIQKRVNCDVTDRS